LIGWVRKLKVPNVRSIETANHGQRFDLEGVIDNTQWIQLIEIDF